MRIESVSQKPDRSGKYRVVIEGGQVLRLYRQTIEDFSICPGRELDEDEALKLKKSAGEMSAKMRAVRIISACSVTERELQKRLEQKGETPEQARNAVSWLSGLNLLDDRAVAEQVVSRCAAKGYGKNRARQALYEKQVPREYWEAVLESFPDQTEKIVDFLRTRIQDPGDLQARKRAADALVRRGFEWSEIRRAMSILFQEYCLED